MYNLGDDNELDRLSRDAAERYLHASKPDWDKMETELDKVLPAEKKRRLRWFWLLPACLAVGAGYWLFSGDHSANTNTGFIQEPAKAVNKTPEGGQQPAATITAREPAAANETAIQPGLPATEKQAGNKQPVFSRHSAQPENDSKTTITTANNQHITSAPSSAEVKQTVEQPAGNTVSTNAGTATRQENKTADNSTPLTQPATTTNTKPATAITADPEEKPTPPEYKRPAIKPLPAFEKGWSISALAGADKSTVKFSYGNVPGYNIGVIGGYHFNKTWSVHTGAVYTQKNYKMNGSDFTPPKGSWVNYYKLENVEGYCKMWEVPLLVRYAFAQHGRNSFFASTGLSSYFMSSEHYSYFFYYNNQPVTRSMEYPSSDSHILSILDLSAGYESRLSKTLSLQIEPYARLPLSGVGLGNISLSSFGINFAVQMRQPSKN